MNDSNLFLVVTGILGSQKLDVKHSKRDLKLYENHSLVSSNAY